MTTEHAYVNVQNAPVSVLLPNGRGLTVLPNHAVLGDHFARSCATGKLVPLVSLPSDKQKGVVVQDPLGLRNPPPSAPPAKPAPTPSAPAKKSVKAPSEGAVSTKGKTSVPVTGTVEEKKTTTKKSFFRKK